MLSKQSTKIAPIFTNAIVNPLVFTMPLVCTLLKQTHPNLYPLAGDDHRFLLKRGCANSVVGLEIAEMCFGRGARENRSGT